MTEHEQHMEVYATSILGVLQLIAKVGLFALQKTKVLSVDAEDMLRKELAGYVNTANKTTVVQVKDNDEAEKAAENKYLKLYQDSEDMRKKCQRVISTMCAVEGVEDDDLDIIEAWSVVKCASGRVLVTVDYWKDNSTVHTYQFPVSWLELSKEQLEERKDGCQLV